MAIPDRPSNRHFYNQMLAWGWVPGKTRDSHIVMVWPGSSVKVTVPSPGAPEAPRDPLVKTVIRITTEGDRERFWNNAPVRIGATKVEYMDDGKVSLSTTDNTRAPKTSGNTGVGRDVLNVLIANGGAMTTKAIHKALHGDYNQQSISNACSYLVGIGNAERVMRGMFKAVIRHQHGSTMHHDVAGSVATAHVTSPTPEPKFTKVLNPEQRELVRQEHADAETIREHREATAGPIDLDGTNRDARTTAAQHDPIPPLSSVTVPLGHVPEFVAPKLPTDQDDDETMNLILDLMFPNGLPSFQKLNAIEAWKKSTLALMKEIRK